MKRHALKVPLKGIHRCRNRVLIYEEFAKDGEQDVKAGGQEIQMMMCGVRGRGKECFRQRMGSYSG